MVAVFKESPPFTVPFGKHPQALDGFHRMGFHSHCKTL